MDSINAVALAKTEILPAIQPGKILTTGMEVAKGTIQETNVGQTNEEMQKVTTETQLPIGTLGNFFDIYR